MSSLVIKFTDAADGRKTEFPVLDRDGNLRDAGERLGKHNPDVFVEIPGDDGTVRYFSKKAYNLFVSSAQTQRAESMELRS